MNSNSNIKLGWREWVSLPDLNIPAIKAKIDTGARTSALHTFHIDTYREGMTDFVKFKIHPLQKRTDIEIVCTAPLLDKRVVKDSGGHAEERFVILSPIALGELVIPAEITLTNREDMKFRMLLGRSALNTGDIEVDPGNSYILGKKLRRAYSINKK